MQRVEVREPDVVGTVFEPDPSTGFAVVLSGSGGGIPTGYAERLADQNITSFALAYFASPGLPDALVEVPIERLARGIRWFRRSFAHAAPIGVMGSSKGAELALLLAAYLGDEVGRVVAIAPTCVTWYGLDQSDRTAAWRSSWTWRGEPVPFLPYASGMSPTFGPDGMRLDMCYDLARYDCARVDAATIPVERFGGATLLLSGGDDHMWPSALFAERVVQRLIAHGRAADVTSVVYEDAGHAFLHREFFANSGRDGRPMWDFGGTVDADDVAARDAWPRVAAFLRTEEN